jgi:hypothetical protein
MEAPADTLIVSTVPTKTDEQSASLSEADVKFGSRKQMIENIGRNVMAWANWPAVRKVGLDSDHRRRTH